MARRVNTCPHLSTLPRDAEHALIAYYRARDDEVTGRVRTSTTVVTAVRPAFRPKTAACLHCGGEHLCGLADIQPVLCAS